MNSTPQILVCGARRRRQGIGEYVARWFAHAGARVCAVVGTTKDTVEEARTNLAERYEIDCQGYTSLEQALETHSPDVVAICTPYRTHRKYLETVARAGVHCLCEKPFWWEDHSNRQKESERLVEAFVQSGKYLDLITQWCYTLPFYYQAYPELKGQPVETFHMWMSPTSQGPEMIVDSAPHIINMLQALVGVGKISRVRGRYNDGDPSQLEIQFTYAHREGSTEVHCKFARKDSPPRPAAYAVNGKWAHRKIELPEYDFYFEGEGDIRVPVEDPLKLLIEDYLNKIDRPPPIPGEILVNGVTELETLVQGVEALEC